ncbi:hypothetical protein ACE193_15480 [Bernardetia sp. OM2101]|uniref:hypothetical protein n=1 Tax=Bernardetia sp. OM2101 TaxID=3344876 RepID=UPI0035CEFFB0
MFFFFKLNSNRLSYKEDDKIVAEKSIDYLKIDTVFFPIDNKNSNLFGYNKWSSRGWGYAEVINDSILFAFDDLHDNMKLLNVYTGKIDTVVNHDVDYYFQGFKEVRGELFRQTHNFLYRFDAKLNLKDSISVSEYLSDDYAQCDYVDKKSDNLFCINILYQKGFEKTKIKKEELTKVLDLERINDSTLQYGINLYKVKQLPKNTTFTFYSKNKIYSVYHLENKYMLLIYTYDSLKGY